METWSWEWGNISYGVNWNGLANELQGKQREKTREKMITTHKRASPWRKASRNTKKKKKERKRREKELQA